MILLQQESCVESETETVHKAVGSSLHLFTDHPKTNSTEIKWKFNQKTFAEYYRSNFTAVTPELFFGRLYTNRTDISVTVRNLRLTDSGTFSIVQEDSSKQYETKAIQLHVHDPIRDGNIQHNVTWLQSKNMCTFHIHCLVFGHVNASFNWSGGKVGNGAYLTFNLTPEARATLNCTASNPVSVKHFTETVVCKKESDRIFGIPQNLLLIAVGAGIVGIAMIIGIIGACYRWRTRREIGESEAGITVYEDVNHESVEKMRSESIRNGMSIYETVDDIKVKPNPPQTLYDKINFERHPAVKLSTSSPYQAVL